MGETGIVATPKSLDYTVYTALSISEVRIKTYDNITPLRRTSVGIYAEPPNWMLNDQERTAEPDDMKSLIILDTQIVNELLWDAFKMPHKALRVQLAPVEAVRPTDKYLPGALELKELQEINITRHTPPFQTSGKIHTAQFYGRFEDNAATEYRKHAEYNLKLVVPPKVYRQLKSQSGLFRVKLELSDKLE